MTITDGRPPLRDFLEGLDNRTGERLEAAAMAEMAGYSVADAQEQGWADMFAAAEAIPMHLDDARPPEKAKAVSAVESFIRGLTYTAPVLAIWSLFPRPTTPTEIRYLGGLVLLSWGGSMASNNAVGTWLWGDVRRAWRIAAGVAALATLAAVAAGLVLERQDLIGHQAAVVGVLQVVYFFCASPLMLLKRRALLTVIAMIGAAAGVGVLLTYLPGGPLGDWPDAQRVLQVVAACSLAAPSLLLLRQLIVTRHAPHESMVTVSRRDTLAFGAYGAAFGYLILWAPIEVPGTSVTVLTLVIVAGIAFAEMALTLIRQRLDALLDSTYDPAQFRNRAVWIIVSGSLVYAFPVALGVTVAVVLQDHTDPASLVAMAVVAVIGLGTIQMFSLIGMALHGIRSVALGLACCATVLGLLSLRVSDTSTLLLVYSTLLVALCAWLVTSAVRLCAHPINVI